MSKISPLGRKLVSRLEDLELWQYLNGLIEVATGSLNKATKSKSIGVAGQIFSLIVSTQTFMCFWPGLPAYVFFPTKFMVAESLLFHCALQPGVLFLMFLTFWSSARGTVFCALLSVWPGVCFSYFALMLPGGVFLNFWLSRWPGKFFSIFVFLLTGLIIFLLRRCY